MFTPVGCVAREAFPRGFPSFGMSFSLSFLSVVHSSKYLIKFLGGREELSNIRSRLQELPNWTDKNFSAHHWNDYVIASPDNDVP